MGATGAGKTTDHQAADAALRGDRGGASCSTASTCASSRSASCAGASRWCSRTSSCSAARSPRTSRWAAPTSTRPRSSARRAPSRPHRFVERAPRRLRDADPRARHEPLRGPAPAALLRARARARRGRAGARRGDQLDRHARPRRWCSTGIHVLMEGKTALVIAHRLSTIEDVDRIHVLHHGRVVESGSHAELLAAGGRLRAPPPAPVRPRARRLNAGAGDPVASGPGAALRRCARRIGGWHNPATPQANRLLRASGDDPAPRSAAICPERGGLRERGSVADQVARDRRLQELRRQDEVRVPARHHRHRRPERLRQVERRRRDPLGDGRAVARAACAARAWRT